MIVLILFIIKAGTRRHSVEKKYFSSDASVQWKKRIGEGFFSCLKKMLRSYNIHNDLKKSMQMGINILWLGLGLESLFKYAN